MEKKDLVIAIDGPAASGKSTVASELAKKWNIAYISTGSLYRALAWALCQSGAEQVTAEFLNSTKLEYIDGGNGFEVRINGFFPRAELRLPEIAAKASAIAMLPEVRAFLLELQRSFAGKKLIVMEGRDIGTVIFPHAKYKFFVTASPGERARRRLAQQGDVSSGATLESLTREIAERDWQDSHRAIAPLRQAEDAVLVDSSSLSISEVVETISKYIDREDL